VDVAIAGMDPQQSHCSRDIVWPISYRDQSLGPGAPDSIPATGSGSTWGSYRKKECCFTHADRLKRLWGKRLREISLITFGRKSVAGFPFHHLPLL